MREVLKVGIIDIFYPSFPVFKVFHYRFFRYFISPFLRHFVTVFQINYFVVIETFLILSYFLESKTLPSLIQKRTPSINVEVQKLNRK